MHFFLEAQTIISVVQHTLVVSFLHLAESANTLSSPPGGEGHWSMSTFCRSMSIPLVPLKERGYVLKHDVLNIGVGRFRILGGGARFRTFGGGGGKGSQIPSRHMAS